MPRAPALAVILVASSAIGLAAAPPPTTVVEGRYRVAPEVHRLDTRIESLFVAGPAAAELDRLLARTTPPRRARTATVAACGTLSPPGRYGHLGRHRRMVSLTRLLRVTDPRGRVLLARPGRC